MQRSMLPSITGRPSKRASNDAKTLRYPHNGQPSAAMTASDWFRTRYVSELPYDFGDGKIIHMGRHSIPSQAPDLFSVGRSSPRANLRAGDRAITTSGCLPKDLPPVYEISGSTANSTCCCKRQTMRLGDAEGRLCIATPFPTRRTPVCRGKGLPHNQANSSSEHQKFCGVDSGAGERCARRLQGWDHANKNCPTVRPLSGGCSQGPFI